MLTVAQSIQSRQICINRHSIELNENMIVRSVVQPGSIWSAKYGQLGRKNGQLESQYETNYNAEFSSDLINHDLLDSLFKCPVIRWGKKHGQTLETEFGNDDLVSYM